MTNLVDGGIIGKGAFGEVCECTDGKNTYAKKVLKPFADPAAESRFVREARILAKMDHPNIVKILYQSTRVLPYWYVMPLYRSSLEQALVDVAKHPARIEKVFRAVLDGVQYAHEEGVIHRDLKPANILMNNDDDVVISDFGLGRFIDTASTRQTQTGYGMGTYFFMAPEQMDDAKHADTRSDIFALGRILYCMYMGNAKLHTQDLSKVPSNIRVIISKCVQTEPGKRFQSVDELKQTWIAVTTHVPKTPLIHSLEKILSRYASNSSAANEILASDLADVLTQNMDDSDFLHNAVMELPIDIAAVMAVGYPDDTKAIFARFCNNAYGESYGFSYTDKIGVKCDAFYNAIDDYEIRADLLYCILGVGYSHNRYAVMNILKVILESPMTPSNGLAIAERIRAASVQHLRSAKANLSPDKLEKHVREVFASL